MRLHFSQMNLNNMETSEQSPARQLGSESYAFREHFKGVDFVGLPLKVILNAF